MVSVTDLEQALIALQGKLYDLDLDKSAKAITVAKKIVKDVPELGKVVEGLTDLALLNATDEVKAVATQPIKSVIAVVILCALATSEVK